MEPTSSKTDDDDDHASLSGRGEEAQTRAVDAWRKCMGESAANVIAGDAEEIAKATGGRWDLVELAAYLAPTQGKPVTRPKPWVMAVVPKWGGKPSAEALEARRKFLEREARKQARSVQAAPGAPPTAGAAEPYVPPKETAREKADGARHMVRQDLEMNGGFNPRCPSARMTAAIFAKSVAALEVMPDGADLAAELARDFAEVLTCGRKILADHAANPGPRARSKRPA